MPLSQGKSKKAFEHNVKAEMNAGKPQDQSLAIAYSVKRKAKKKMANGGMAYKNDSAKTEGRPMPSERDNDSKMVSRNSGNKPAKNDSWTDNSTIAQAQKPSITKLSRPALRGSDAFSVRYKTEIDEDLDRMNSMPPETDTAPPPKRDDEEGANRQGPKVSDMAAQHNNKKAPYNKEIEDQYAQDMAAAEMKKTQSYANGGPVMEPKDSGIEARERSNEADLQSSESPSEDEADSDARSRNELDADEQNPNDLDMEHEHSNGRKPYASGGTVRSGSRDMDYADGGEVADDHEDSLAAAIMSRKDRESAMNSDSDEDEMINMALGGEIIEDDNDIHSHGSMESDDSDQADLSRNADEDANEEDQASFNALRKENYSESDGLDELDSPKDSNTKGHELSDEDENDMVDSVRRKMNKDRQFKAR